MMVAIPLKCSSIKVRAAYVGRDQRQTPINNVLFGGTCYCWRRDLGTIPWRQSPLPAYKVFFHLGHSGERVLGFTSATVVDPFEYTNSTRGWSPSYSLARAIRRVLGDPALAVIAVACAVTIDAEPFVVQRCWLLTIFRRDYRRITEMITTSGLPAVSPSKPGYRDNKDRLQASSSAFDMVVDREQ